MRVGLIPVLGLMESMRKVSRLLLLLVGIGLSLVYLNSAVYSAWAAGGPPTDNPEGWMFRAVNHFALALAFLSAGIASFLLLRRPILRGPGLFVLVISMALALVPTARKLAASHGCSAAGESWSAEELRCRGNSSEA